MATERIDNPFAARRAPATAPGRADLRAPAGEPDGAPARAPAPAFRAMTGHEEEVVEQRQRDPNTAALCNEIVARCLVAPGADFGAAYERVRAMPTVARDAALVQIRRESLGDVVELEVACPSCGRKNDLDFKLGDLPLPSADFPAEVEVDLGGAGRATARIPSAGDQEDLLAAGLRTEAERRTFLLARVLVRYGEAEGPFDAAFARALPISARAAIEKAIESATPDLDLSMAVHCSECGADFTSPFDVAAFFLPR